MVDKNEKILCPTCNKKISYSNMAIHKKTKGHLDKSSIIKPPKLIYEKREKQSFEEDELDKMN
uniref:hypothetical protein n=1 Tax=Bartonella sp. CL43QHWL TaxID=3243532 RepID=UPI0035CF5D5F